MGGLSLVAYFYPDPSQGFYMKGGLGRANFSFGGEAGHLTGATITGLSGTFGLGHDFHRGGNFALTPYISFQVNKFDFATTNTIMAGLGFNWY